MKDRLVAGGLAGAIAGVIQYGYGLLAFKVGLTDRFFGQFSDVVFGRVVYTGVLGFVISILTHLAVTITFGILFAYLIKKTSSSYYILKSAIYGLILWFFLSGFGTVFKLPLFTDIPARPAIIILTGSMIYGLSLGYALKIMDKKSALL